MNSLSSMSSDDKLKLFSEVFIGLMDGKHTLTIEQTPYPGGPPIHISKIGKLNFGWTEQDFARVKEKFGEDWVKGYYLEVVYSGLKSALQGDKA